MFKKERTDIMVSQTTNVWKLSEDLCSLLVKQGKVLTMSRQKDKNNYSLSTQSLQQNANTEQEDSTVEKGL